MRNNQRGWVIDNWFYIVTLICGMASLYAGMETKIAKLEIIATSTHDDVLDIKQAMRENGIMSQLKIRVENLLVKKAGDPYVPN